MPFKVLKLSKLDCTKCMCLNKCMKVLLPFTHTHTHPLSHAPHSPSHSSPTLSPTHIPHPSLPHTMLGKEIDGTAVEVTLAKPVDKDTLALHRQARRNRTLSQSGSLAPVAYVPVECGSYLAPLYGHHCYQ